METITLDGVLPAAFADDPAPRGPGLWRSETTLRKGKYYLIEAASGTGKSSLCAFLYGSRRDYTGRIAFDGTDCAALSAAQWGAVRRRSLSLLFQDLRLFGELTVAENIALKNDLTHFKTRAEIRRLMEAAGIASKSDTPACRLSVGQQQRAAFVRSLCQPFDFILLDEPVSHLDAANARAIALVLLEEARRQGAGIVTTSVGNRLDLPYHKTFTL